MTGRKPLFRSGIDFGTKTGIGSIGTGASSYFFDSNGPPGGPSGSRPFPISSIICLTLRQGKRRQHPTGAVIPAADAALSQVNEDTLKSWFDHEALTGKNQAARALMMFRGLLRWCSAKPEYRALVDRDAGKAADIVEGLPSTRAASMP